ncbi:hypothetical protein [Meiothermus taiwanensis]|jgi:hypothetical protein|uniref:Uncharacterized protein n=2 Tax=Meiothermus taiwanensis TaxID=172827 RepID=A0A399E6U3_9DEIN|nr:hypothetical protein [Meiothermus taiwanensis]AWR87486.1 hypothetical protein Mtai_v1c22550 [Meiothermus taiwanensis WR-220]KIQ56053.1 hypothetical protein SY28_00385 [Meiothermus taiwanensis]RIH78470.1 hypothetical protein Mcate_00792 [Meiothermus taiwanensis]
MKKIVLAAMASLGIGGAALADGFSITGNLQFLPEVGLVGGQFTTPYRSYRGTALNYSFNLSDNIVAGASLRPGFFAGQFVLASRAGLVGVAKLNESSSGYVEGAVRLGSNQVLLPGPFSFDFDAGAEIFITQRIANAAALYGGAGLDVALVVVPSLSLNAAANAYAGLKLELTRDLNAYLEGGLRYPFGLGLGYDVTASLYYTVLRGLRLGIYGGYANPSGAAGAWKLGIAGEWTEKPETLGTPGNYLP